MMRRIYLLVITLMVAACNLQQQVTPTPETTAVPVVVSPSPPQPGTALPTLQPTPTQIVLVSATPGTNPTTVNFTGDGTIVPGQPTQDAALFDERYEVAARAESTITVIFDVTVTGGLIFMILQGPDGLIWEKTFTATEAGREPVAVVNGGIYEILVDRQNLSGSYAVSWE
jgi:hypothetical protein